MTRLIWISFCFFLLTGCSILKEIDKTKDWSQKKLFTEATYELKGGDYEKAIDYYEKLESRYPFGKYVHQAQLNTAYAYYRSGLPKEALAAAAAKAAEEEEAKKKAEEEAAENQEGAPEGEGEAPAE